jgi:hypothetical protein
MMTAMTLILSACATTEASAQTCGNLNTPSVVLPLNLDKFELVLKNKKKMCLDFRQLKADRFRIKVDVGSSGYTWASGAIMVESKNQSTGQPVISGTNSATDPDLIWVDVTDASVPGTNSADYEYWIKVPGVGTLDPIVRIIRTSYAPLLAQDVEAALLDVGVSLEDIDLDHDELVRLLSRKFESQELGKP